MITPIFNRLVNRKSLKSHNKAYESLFLDLISLILEIEKTKFLISQKVFKNGNYWNT